MDENQVVMKKYLFSICLLILCCFESHSQNQIKWSKDAVKNLEGFAVRDTSQGLNPEFTFLKKKETVKVNGVKYTYTNIVSLLSPNMSWVNKNGLNQESIKMVQSQFNVFEEVMREYRSYMLFNKEESEMVNNRHFIRLFKERVDSLYECGKLEEYQIEDDTFDISKVEIIKEKNSRDIYFGLMNEIPLSDLSRLTYPTIGLSIMYNWKREKDSFGVNLNAGVAIGKKELMDFNGSVNEYISIFADYGRHYKVNKLTLSGFAGLGFSSRIFSKYNSGIMIGGPALKESFYLDIPGAESINFSSRKANSTTYNFRIGINLTQIYNLYGKGIIPTVGLSAGILFNNTRINRK